MAILATPNTAEKVDGKSPAQFVYNYVKTKHICCKCRQRWVEPMKLLCDICDAYNIAYVARRARKKKNVRDTNPKMVEVVVAQELRGSGLVLQLQSDAGTLLTVHNLQSVDVRDAQAGKAKITGYRAEKAA